MFWKTNCHEDFHSDLFVLNQNEALKYFPSVQQSCKIFNSDNEQISVDLFKSAYVNGKVIRIFKFFKFIYNVFCRYVLAVYWWS